MRFNISTLVVVDWPKWPQLILMSGNACEGLDRWIDTQDQQTLEGREKRKLCSIIHILTFRNSSKPEHTAVLIMVHDTLAYYKKQPSRVSFKTAVSDLFGPDM